MPARAKIEEILKYLPHRYPMLLIDRILELQQDKFCRGLKNVSINEPFFQGHYPGTPIMPGVLIVEAIAQTSAMILLANPAYEEYIPILGAMENVKLKQQVTPGDQLIMDVELLWYRNFIGKVSGLATVDGKLVASADLTFKLIKREE